MYKSKWVPAAAKDFACVEQFKRADGRLQRILENPYAESQQVVGWNGTRKIRVGNYRLFIFIDNTSKIVYGLAFLPRDSCYKERMKVMGRL